MLRPAENDDGVRRCNEVLLVVGDFTLIMNGAGHDDLDMDADDVKESTEAAATRNLLRVPQEKEGAAEMRAGIIVLPVEERAPPKAAVVGRICKSGVKVRSRASAAAERCIVVPVVSHKKGVAGQRRSN